MHRFVAQLNIDHYRELLARETNESKRRVIEQLLAEEEVRLAAAKREAKDQKTG